ncbi:preprotein translocase subunit TatA [Bdellovibrio bacteriovorus]|uniref:Sec-independent protein translocase protein TatA n=1 Tax=Bdellovibrio bacteriovorus TaxID=959 RepID=A0A162G6H9_BDEBC|nr:twin-arginine translocase TatA/TatE family subunit [Bdellovibrio bacteriovorus]KYG65104.1 preprotein translocase subunit TatA [Bdellovibrio bacteriovorus]
MGEFSLTHILLLAILGLIFFGPSRLPQLGQGLGKAIRGFKQGLNEIDVDPKDIQDHKQVNHTSQQATQSQKQTETQNS